MWREYLGVAAVGAGAVLGLAWLAKRSGLSASSFNPASADNLVARAANNIIQGVTGDPNQTVGGLAYDLANPRAGLADNETVGADGQIVVRVPAVTPLPAAGMGDDNAWWYGGGFAQTLGGAVTGIVRKP